MTIFTVIALISILIISATYGRIANRAQQQQQQYPTFKVNFETPSSLSSSIEDENHDKYHKTKIFPHSHTSFKYKLLENIILPPTSSSLIAINNVKDKIDKILNLDRIHIKSDDTVTDNILQLDETIEVIGGDDDQLQLPQSSQLSSQLQHNDIADSLPIDFITNYKRNSNSNIGCECKMKNDVIDLGYSHYPRYLLNAVCQNENDSTNKGPRKCWRGAQCKPMEYKVHVLTLRSMSDDAIKKSTMNTLLPEMLQPYWKFKTITVAAGCVCSFK